MIDNRRIRLAAGLVAVSAALLFAQEAERPVFRVKVDMVVLTFTVTDSRGRYVNGLKPGDFRIQEDGISQKIATFAEGSSPAVQVLADGSTRPVVLPEGASPGMDRPADPLVGTNVFVLFDTSNYMYRGFVYASDAIADFIRGFADGCHHHKEENVLFKMMAEQGLPVEGGPVGVMLQEHELGRQYTRGMRAAAEKWEQGDESARPEVLRNALGYVALLRQHIAKENNILFPMADRVIPRVEHPAVLEGFEHVENEETGEGIHEKYLALAEKLSLEAVGV